MSPNENSHRHRRPWIAAGLLLALALILAGLASQAEAAPRAQDTPTETSTPTQTSTPGGFARPVIVLESYGPGAGIYPGQDFNLSFRLANPGQATAYNILVSFEAGDLLPRGTGGVIAAGIIAASASTGYTQPMTASPDLEGMAVATTRMTVTYTDFNGNAFTETFTLTLPLAAPTVVVPAGGWPTRTPTPGPAPQLLILDVRTDPPVLSQGTRFTVHLRIANVGGSMARRVTMIVGGGSTGGQVTPGVDPGGLSGASGDYTHFAPVGSSNVQFLGDLPSGMSFEATHNLIVNSNTQAGAYPLRVSFVHADEGGAVRTDDQIITLLVYNIPSLDISFYRPVDPLMVGQPGPLPVQVVNIGRNSVILGEMRVQAEGVEVMNDSILIGLLDPGGYFTLDAMAVPVSTGTLEFEVIVHYVDDFNAPQTVRKTLRVEVIEGFEDPGPVPGFEGPTGGPPAVAPQTFWQIVWRAVLGLLGLDSAPPSMEAPAPDLGPMPPALEVPLG